MKVRKAARCIDCGSPSDLELNPSGLWCTACEMDRRARIDGQMAKITASFASDAGDDATDERAK